MRSHENGCSVCFALEDGGKSTTTLGLSSTSGGAASSTVATESGEMGSATSCTCFAIVLPVQVTSKEIPRARHGVSNGRSRGDGREFFREHYFLRAIGLLPLEPPPPPPPCRTGGTAIGSCTKKPCPKHLGFVYGGG